MSILIKALKQAERDHMARSAAADTPPVAAVAEALSLEPVELQTRAVAAPDRERAPAPRAPAPESAPAERAQAPVRVAAESPASAPPARAEVPAAEMQEVAAAAAPSRPAAEPRLRISDSKPGVSAPAPAVPQPGAAGSVLADLEAERRKAARQILGTANPNAPRGRKLAIFGAIALVLAASVGLAYWQGWIPGVSGSDTATNLPPPPPAGETQSLADRLQHASAKKPQAAAHSARPSPLPSSGASPGAASQSASTQRDTAAAPPSAPGAVDKDAHAGVAARHDAASTAQDGAPPAGIHLRAPDVAPDRIRAMLQDAYSAAARGDTAGARNIYQQITELDRNCGDAWIGLGALAANTGDAAAANHFYRRALEIDPGDDVALGGLLGLQGGNDPQEAETRLRVLIARDGAQPALVAALGRILARQGRWLDAQETFFHAWTMDPTQPDVAFNLAVSLERIRQPAVAATFYQRALQLAENHAARFDPAFARERVAALTSRQP